MEYCRSSLTPCAAAGRGRGSLAPRNWETFSQLSGFSTLVCNLLRAAQIKPLSSFEIPFPWASSSLWWWFVCSQHHGKVLGGTSRSPQPTSCWKKDERLLPCQAVMSISSEEVSITCLGGLWHLIVVTVGLEVTLKELWPFVPHPSAGSAILSTTWELRNFCPSVGLSPIWLPGVKTRQDRATCSVTG